MPTQTPSIRFTVYLAPSDYSSILADFCEEPKPVSPLSMMRIIGQLHDGGMPMDIAVDSPGVDVLEEEYLPETAELTPEEDVAARWTITVKLSKQDYSAFVQRAAEQGQTIQESLCFALAAWKFVKAPDSLQVEVDWVTPRRSLIL